jgi:GNAT superfamily N-acetyltransferase
MDDAKRDSSPMTLRPLRSDDLDAISRIHVAACRVAYRFMNWDYSVAEVREWYSGKVEEWDWVRVAELSGGVAGYIAMKGGHIDQFFVDPPRQGRGVGSVLFATALDRGLRPLTLDVFEANLPARRFYEKRGFKERERWFNEQDRAVQLRYVLG